MDSRTVVELLVCSAFYLLDLSGDFQAPYMLDQKPEVRLYFNRVILATVLKIVEGGRESRSRGCYKNRGEKWAILDYEMIAGEINICIWKFGWQGASKIC